MSKALNNAITQIQKIPLYHFSLTSKELFHSNFLKWYSTVNIGFFQKLFEQNNLVRIEREINGKQIEVNGKKYTPKADLVGYDSNDNAVILVENKVKDIPNSEQCNNLKASFDNSIETFILSTTEPIFELNDWKFIKYSELCKLMASDLTNTAIIEYHKNLVQDYISLIEYISEIIDNYNISNNYDFALASNKEFINKLNEIKFLENYQRVAGESFRSRVFEVLKKEFPDLETCFGINNQKATIDFLFTWNDLRIGIQLEDKQYRKFVHGDFSVETAKNLISDNSWFRQDFRLRRKKKGEVEASSYGSYDIKKKRKFIYQYCNEFYDNCKVSFDEVTNKIRGDLKYLTSIENKQRIERILAN